jgi:ribosomal protein S18 acetylase RimI-like enzyme
MAMPFVKVKNKAQISRVAQLAKDIWEEYYPAIISQGQIAYMIDTFQSPAAIESQIAEGMQYYLTVTDGEEIGYLAYTAEQGNVLFLSKIYITRDFRNKGKGREAFEFITQQASNSCCNKIWLTVNKHNKAAIDKYLKIGFTITESVKKEIGNGFYMDDYVMEYRV